MKRVQNARNCLSNEWFCMKFGLFLAEILKSEYAGNFAVESILKFTLSSKLKTERNFNRVVQNGTGPQSKHL